MPPPLIIRKISRKLKSALRSASRLLIAEQTLAHLRAIREHELTTVAALLPARGTLLEIGAGTGWQAAALATRGFAVSAVDLPGSKYAADRMFPVQDYDGHTLPFPDGSFEIIYSSNLLEHIPHLAAFQEEIHRVLRPDGLAIHVLPSSAWRLWTNLTHLVRYRRRPHAHGEHATNALTEIAAFSRREWRRIFAKAGWTIVAEQTNQLFYTGSSILDARLSIRMRVRLSRLLGSACNIFVLRKPAGSS